MAENGASKKQKTEEKQVIAQVRTECIICAGELSAIHSRKNFPATFSPPDTADCKDDHYVDQRFLVCEMCGCVQLGDVIDPDILYHNSHNITAHTPTWNEHHNQLCDFVLEHLDRTNVIEVGGLSGVLAERIMKKRSDIVYHCMDVCKPDELPKFASFSQGNCEDFEFDSNKALVMSHVFEHLFMPLKFVQNVARCKVPQVFISIPDMTSLMEACNIQIVHNEHTYYVDKTAIEWMFASVGYSLTQHFTFRTHSGFFLFTPTNCAPLKLENRSKLSRVFLQVVADTYSKLLSVTIPPNSFIVPGGHFGQLVHSMVRPPALLGFLDNDPCKQGKRVYGTSHFVFPFSEVEKYKEQVVHFWVHAGPYTEEIAKQLRKTCSAKHVIHLL